MVLSQLRVSNIMEGWNKRIVHARDNGLPLQGPSHIRSPSAMFSFHFLSDLLRSSFVRTRGVGYCGRVEKRLMVEAPICGKTISMVARKGKKI